MQRVHAVDALIQPQVANGGCRGGMMADAPAARAAPQAENPTSTTAAADDEGSGSAGPVRVKKGTGKKRGKTDTSWKSRVTFNLANTHYQVCESASTLVGPSCSSGLRVVGSGTTSARPASPRLAPPACFRGVPPRTACGVRRVPLAVCVRARARAFAPPAWALQAPPQVAYSRRPRPRHASHVAVTPHTANTHTHTRTHRARACALPRHSAGRRERPGLHDHQGHGL